VFTAARGGETSLGLYNISVLVYTFASVYDIRVRGHSVCVYKNMSI